MGGRDLPGPGKGRPIFKHRPGCGRRWLILVMLAALLVPVPADARYSIVFTPTLTMDCEFTDNVDLAQDDSESDLITIVSPGFELTAASGQNGLSVSYSPGYSQYADHSAYNTLRHEGRLKGWQNLSRTATLGFSDVFRRSEDPISGSKEDTDGINSDTTVRSGRSEYYENTAQVDFLQALTKFDDLALAYSHRLVDNRSGPNEDSISHNPSVNVTHRFDSFMDLGVNLAYTRGEFSGASDDFNQWKAGFVLNRHVTKDLSLNLRYSHTVMSFAGTSVNYQIYDPSLGLSLSLDEDSLLAFNVGYFNQAKGDGTGEKGVSVTGDLGKSWALKKGRVSLSGASGYDHSYFGAENLGFNIFHLVRLDANYGLSRSVQADLALSHKITDYKEAAGDREDTQDTAEIGLAWTPATMKWLSARIGYAFSRVDSTRTASGYDDNRIEFQISMDKTLAKKFRLN